LEGILWAIYKISLKSDSGFIISVATDDGRRGILKPPWQI
jgi:hypothetical protein